MEKRGCFFLFGFALLLSLCLTGSEISLGGDNNLKPEDVLAAHLNSIGSPAVIAGVKNRGISGTASVQFIQGGTGKLAGQSVIVSAGTSLGIIMKYGGLEYPGEYFAFDGKDVTVSTISPGQRSPLADFIYRHGGLMKEGLLGGVFSLGWPPLRIAQRKPTLRYDSAKIDGRELHQIEYIPRDGLNDFKIKLFFDKETFRHVRTEYRLRVRGEQGLQADAAPLTRGGANPVSRSAGIQDSISDSNYLLVERFENFKEENGLTLPHSYSIEYSVAGQGSSFLANWKIEAAQFLHNGNIDGSFFKAH